MTKEIEELAQEISYNLGLIEGEQQRLLYDNYPDSFNEIIPELARKLYELGYRRIPEELPLLTDEEIEGQTKYANTTGGEIPRVGDWRLRALDIAKAQRDLIAERLKGEG